MSSLGRIGRTLAVSLLVGGGLWSAAAIDQAVTSWFPPAALSFALVVSLHFLLAPEKAPKPERGYHFDFEETFGGKIFGVLVLTLAAILAVRGFDFDDPVLGGFALGGVTAMSMQFLRELVNGNADERPC